MSWVWRGQYGKWKGGEERVSIVDDVGGKKYSIILADPPWSYRDRALAGNRGSCCKYNVESTEWISALPVGEISADDGVLFLWVTMPKLNEVFDVISAWGVRV